MYNSGRFSLVETLTLRKRWLISEFEAGRRQGVYTVENKMGNAVKLNIR